MNSMHSSMLVTSAGTSAASRFASPTLCPNCRKQSTRADLSGGAAGGVGRGCWRRVRRIRRGRRVGRAAGGVGLTPQHCRASITNAISPMRITGCVICWNPQRPGEWDNSPGPYTAIRRQQRFSVYGTQHACGSDRQDRRCRMYALARP